ncbi:MAG: DNA cytosine methyltransferase [Candidatus Hodarchaeota archaeon]
MLSYCDLFCGCGGFSLGFKQNGYRHLGALDVDLMAWETYRANISNKVLNQDITEMYSLEFRDYLGERPDIVLAAPPCEGFTEANEKRKKNAYERLYTEPGSLTIKAIDWICDLNPRIGFIIENVPAIMDHPIKGYLIDEFSRIGYDEVYFNIIRAELLGSASKRPRMFISNMKFDESEIELGNEYYSVLDAIGNLPDPTDVHDVPDHVVNIVTKSKKQGAIHLLKWSDSVVRYKGASGTKKNWIRIHPYKKSPIVMGKSTLVHPYEDRQLTIREYARLQGFPDDFIFHGNFYDKRNQIGEAVSPVVSDFLARKILEHH